MKILIIGATGFLGRKIVRRLLDLGHQVVAISRGHAPSPPGPHPRLILIHGDRHDAGFLRAARRLGPFDVIYDIIAYEPADSRLAVEIFAGQAGRFIHCSTISVYMVSEQVTPPITEEQDHAPLMPWFERNPFGMEYGIQKRGCEEVLWRAHADGKLKVTMLRPTFIAGPHDPAMRDYFWIERIRDGGPLLVPGSGDFAFQSVYVEDVAAAFVTLLQREETIGRAYNIAADEMLTLNQYLHLLGRILEREPRLVHVDQELFDNLPFSRHPAGDVFPYNTRRDARFSLERIRADLDYRSTPMAEWLALTVEWFTTRYHGHSVGYEFRRDELAFVEAWKGKTDSC